MELILSTCSAFEAEKIAKELLNLKLVACVNIINNVKSFYWWDGKLTEDEEVLLIIKTKSAHVEETMNKIKDIHSYNNPEIISIKMNNGTKEYFSWIERVVK